MSTLRSPWKIALSVAALLVAAQIVVSLSVRTHRVHEYLSAHLERAFGRPVQVRHFNVEILPSPRIYATGVTVGEDTAFGYEYFLRAEHLTAGLRWSGFLRGHFEFGTLSLGQPSLNLVRNSEGRWNLEDWLPPAKRPVQDFHVYGPSRAPAIANRLEKIEFDDGRINFKSGEIKEPFALTGVNGSVEQISLGRWKLQLEAQPWRSGVSLQSTGTIEVRGDIAGTSARLQPASFTVRWDKVSLADMFRLIRGQDYGVRGTFALEATAKSGAPAVTSVSQTLASQPLANESLPGDWSFALRASATQIHRWDLTERPDNPALTTSVEGRWNVALGTLTAENLLVETPVSNLRGTAQFHGAATPFMRIKFDSAGIQAAELLSWYRAFRADVTQGITADQFFSGSVALQGWPVKLQAMDFSSQGGVVTIPGVDDELKIGPARVALDQSTLRLDPLRVSFLRVATPAAAGRAIKRRASDESGDVQLTLRHDFSLRAGEIAIKGRVEKAENILKIATAFGYPLNHGWDLTGPARGDLHRQWFAGAPGTWNGAAEVNDARLAAAGLNQPVRFQQARLEWRNGKRAAQITQAEGFGATWSGSVDEDASNDPDHQGTWNVQLRADHLDATELDRWVGPRARPGWLQRLLPSLLGGSARSTPASELVRRLNVSGDLQVDEFTIEKLKLQQLHLQGSMHDLQVNITDGRAQWAGGAVRATMLAKFVPRPVYDVKARLEGVELTQLPIDTSLSERLGGVASGTLHLKTTGVGRDELLQKLTGTGEMHLSNLEFRGWDVNASVADGEAHPGVSRWAAGDGAFTVLDRGVTLEDIRLDGGAETTLVNGTVSFARDANLAVETSTGRRTLRNTSTPGHVLKIVGPLDGPRVSREKGTPREPAD
jgi:AsmA family